jgi:cysteine-rich repeat protein
MLWPLPTALLTAAALCWACGGKVVEDQPGPSQTGPIAGRSGGGAARALASGGAAALAVAASSPAGSAAQAATARAGQAATSTTAQAATDGAGQAATGSLGQAVVAANDLCGNGQLDPGEDCEDYNHLPGDDCGAECRLDLPLP